MKTKISLFSEIFSSGYRCNYTIENTTTRCTQAKDIGTLVCLLACVFIVLASPNPVTAAPQNLTEWDPGVATSPSASISGSDRWVAWLDYTYVGAGNESAAIKAQHFDGSVSVEGPLTVASGRVMAPVVLTVDSDTAWFFWIEVGLGSSQLRARRRQNGVWAAPVTVSINRAAYPTATLDINGNPWVAWENYSGERAEIYVSNWNGARFVTPTRVSQQAVPAYSPAIETDTEGGIWAAWHANVGSNFEILIRRYKDGLWRNVWQVTEPFDGDGDFLGMHVMPTLSHGTNGQVWVAWVAKGLDVRAPGKPPHLYGWVIDRRIQLCRVWPDGSTGAIRQVPVPIDTFVDPDLERKYRGPDRPILLFARNKVMVFFRLLINDPTRVRPFHWRAWMQFMDPQSGRWLPTPFNIAEDGETIGEPDAPAVADTGTGFIAAWQKGAAPPSYPDGFSDPVSDILMNEVFDSNLGVPSAVGEAVHNYATPVPLDKPRPRTTISYNGNLYQLLHGTLHSHTVNSNCANYSDDLLRENYRRARDLVALDFYSITDHGHQMSHFDWFFNRILCDLNKGVGGMTTLLGLEYTNLNYGHQSVIHDSCDGQLYSYRSQTTPESLWNSLSADHTLAIPHHTAESLHYLDYDLRHFNADFNRLYEIYQARGSYECYDCIGGFPEPWPSLDSPFWYYNKPPDSANGVGYFQDALAMGLRMGVIASPDHTGMWGITGVYAASGSQDDIFEALTARRTYGVSNAAARITMDFRGNDHIMGEEFELTEGCPAFSGYVRTDYINPSTGQPGRIDEVKIYRVTDVAPGENGELFKIEPGTNEVNLTFYDADCPSSGSAAYYLRATQTDVYGVDQLRRPSVAWTSPIFVNWRSGGANLYTSVTPCRIVDTRLAGGAITAGGVRSYDVWGTVGSQGGNPAGCPSPEGEPLGVHINVTAVPLGNGHIVAYSAGSTAPNSSLVNYRAGVQNIANAGSIRTCFNCAKDINIKAAYGAAHIVIDVLGYYYPIP